MDEPGLGEQHTFCHLQSWASATYRLRFCRFWIHVFCLFGGFDLEREPVLFLPSLLGISEENPFLWDLQGKPGGVTIDQPRINSNPGPVGCCWGPRRWAVLCRVPQGAWPRPAGVLPLLGPGVLGSLGELLPGTHLAEVFHVQKYWQGYGVGRGSRGGKRGGCPCPQVPCPAVRGTRVLWLQPTGKNFSSYHRPHIVLSSAMPPRFVCCHCGDVELHEEFPAGPKASSSTLPLTQPSPFPYFLLFPFQWVSYSIYNFLYYSTLIDYLLCGALLNVL